MEKDNDKKSEDDNEGKVISLESRRATKSRAAGGASPEGSAEIDAAGLAAIPGVIFWLRCPTCGTLEYTEMEIPGGRKHKCGTMVEEARVEVDVRAEFTVAVINLERIRALGEYLDAQRHHYEEYQRRLETLAGKVPTPYSISENPAESLPVKEMDPLGLLVSQALHDPASRFGDGGK